MKKRLLICCAVVSIACKKEVKETQTVMSDTIMTEQNTPEKETVTFPSKDSLDITADIYIVKNTPITIVLCHQAGFSRGEYNETAKLLNELGYSVMAIDQRSGEEANGVINETAKRAKEKHLPTTYVDARQDIEAAIDFAFNKNGNIELILVGSSYSATLGLLIANKSEKVKAVAAFSPGEYFKGMNIQQQIKEISKPVYVTSSLEETKALQILVSKVKKDNLTQYLPLEKGIHGSRALWESTEGYHGHWNSFKGFLNAL